MKIIFKNARQRRQRAKELQRKFMKIENRGYKKRTRCDVELWDEGSKQYKKI
jgi:hypothetical protein